MKNDVIRDIATLTDDKIPHLSRFIVFQLIGKQGGDAQQLSDSLKAFVGTEVTETLETADDATENMERLRELLIALIEDIDWSEEDLDLIDAQIDKLQMAGLAFGVDFGVTLAAIALVALVVKIKGVEYTKTSDGTKIAVKWYKLSDGQLKSLTRLAGFPKDGGDDGE